MPVAFGTVAVYEEMARLLNADEDWLQRIGCKISFTMVFAYTEPVDARFLVRFQEGRVIEVRDLAPPDEVSADFVISGPPDVWRGVLTKQINPQIALTRGQLKVDGKLSVLLRNMGAFSHVINTMMTVEFV